MFTVTMDRQEFMVYVEYLFANDSVSEERAAGRTTEVIGNVIQYATSNRGGHVYVMVHSTYWAKDLGKMIREALRAINVQYNLHMITPSGNNLLRGGRGRVFVDNHPNLMFDL